jgi:hypothetical protein
VVLPIAQLVNSLHRLAGIGVYLLSSLLPVTGRLSFACVFGCWGLAFLNERTDMRFAADIGLQAKILEDIEDLYLKRRDLEDRIRNVDWLNKLRIEKGALLDIEAYRADHLRPDGKCGRELNSKTATASDDECGSSRR